MNKVLVRNIRNAIPFDDLGKRREITAGAQLRQCNIIMLAFRVLYNSFYRQPYNYYYYFPVYNSIILLYSSSTVLLYITQIMFIAYIRLFKDVVFKSKNIIAVGQTLYRVFFSPIFPLYYCNVHTYNYNTSI